MSPQATSTVGSSCRWRARGKRRVATRIRPSPPPERSTSFSQTLRPTKPVAPRMRKWVTGRVRRRRRRRRATILAEPAGQRQGRSFSGGGAFGSGGPMVRPRRERRAVPLPPSERRVVGAVREHLLDVVARLGERDVLDPDGGIEHRPLAPLARPARAGVVGRCGHRLRAAGVVEDELQVGVAELEVGVAVGDERGAVGQADLLRGPLRRRRHELHQARTRRRPIGRR